MANKMFNEKDLINKTISDIEIDGYGIRMTTTDGLILDYEASDGGCSLWDIFEDFSKRLR